MPYYGYDPGRYVPDLSGIATAGAQLGQGIGTAVKSYRDTKKAEEIVAADTAAAFDFYDQVYHKALEQYRDVGHPNPEQEVHKYFTKLSATEAKSEEGRKRFFARMDASNTLHLANLSKLQGRKEGQEAGRKAGQLTQPQSVQEQVPEDFVGPPQTLQAPPQVTNQAALQSQLGAQGVSAEAMEAPGVQGVLGGLPETEVDPIEQVDEAVKQSGGMNTRAGINRSNLEYNQLVKQGEQQIGVLKKAADAVAGGEQRKALEFGFQAGLQAEAITTQGLAEAMSEAQQEVEDYKLRLKSGEDQLKEFNKTQAQKAAPRPKSPTPETPGKAADRLINATAKMLKQEFPNDVEEIKDPVFGKITGYRVLPNTAAAAQVDTPEKRREYIQLHEELRIIASDAGITVPPPMTQPSPQAAPAASGNRPPLTSFDLNQ